MPSIQVKGMSCRHCADSVTQALQGINGISGVKVDLASGQVSYEESQPVDAETIKAAIAGIGFEVVG